MECFVPELVAALQHLGAAGGKAAAAQVQDDGDACATATDEMQSISDSLPEAEEELDGDDCSKFLSLAKAASSLAAADGEEAKEAFDSECQSPPEKVSPQLWDRLGKMFLSAGRMGVAEAQGDDAALEREDRNFNRHSRALAGMGKMRSCNLKMDEEEYERSAASVIPATVIMFSGCKDSQTSADVYNTASFGLPDEAGPGGAGGACTSSLIKALSDKPEEEYSWVSLLKEMREILRDTYTQIPMLSSSRKMDLNGRFGVTQDGGGKCRALLVGINYVGSSCELKGCQNDVLTVKTYLLQHGYSEDDMMILMDDGEHENPTKAKMVEGMKWLVEGAAQGDSLFFHYSGHGASVRDDDGDEDDGKDEALCPVDYQDGLLRDDEVYATLVGPLQEGVLLTCVLDCCHSGTIMDLPFQFEASDENTAAFESGETSGMTQNPNFDFGKLLEIAKDCCGALLRLQS
eukprot:TRINITY_DN11251_c0_g1_i2.p1 TRINITY_DN11251_c0_g1~~TRINITY_DN11251_c0_g1_i2.p1  ORF type:complete len:461 (-),score=132.51 TRINITY_DN11251_c0_g1_i2:69-1451(-)